MQHVRECAVVLPLAQPATTFDEGLVAHAARAWRSRLCGIVKASGVLPWFLGACPRDSLCLRKPRIDAQYLGAFVGIPNDSVQRIQDPTEIYLFWKSVCYA